MWEQQLKFSSTVVATDLDDSVIADPQFIASLPHGNGSLCYEVHGDANEFFNLISDTCSECLLHSDATGLEQK